MTVFYYTFGCKVNTYETDAIKELMQQSGHTETNDFSLAEVFVINSCTVTGVADDKLFKLLRRIKRENEKAVIVICGCLPQVDANNEALKDADILLGTANKSQIPEALEKFSECKEKQVLINPHEKGEKIEALQVSGRKGKTRAIIKIQDGCDRFCSYCIIPFARGRSRSKPLDEITKEAQDLVQNGHKELVLVGINLSCYGYEWGLNLADAVEAVCKNSSALRVRLGSLEPELLTKEIIERLSKLPQFCPHFHLSLQSGCNKTLKEMRRKYTKEEYLSLVTELRNSFPNCAITTDIMVGFAGETEEDFLESLEFVKEVKFAQAHIFPYSERPGTVASRRSDQVDVEARHKRAKIMADATKIAEIEFLEAQVGLKVPVLFERDTGSDFHQGHTPNYLTVKVPKICDTLWKEIKEVEIIGIENGCCVGRII